jgi:uncharacterized protein
MRKIWIDSDACPVRIRDLIARAAHRRAVPAVFVANKPIALPQSGFLSSILVPREPDAADSYIEENAQSGDLVVTQDIPLAALLVPKGVAVIAPRGTVFTPDNIADLLSHRDLMTELRDIGEVSTRTPPLDDATIRRFASSFDAALHKLNSGR